MSIQFDELERFTTTHFGLYYERIRDRFQVPVDQPRLPPIHEAFPRPLIIPRFRLASAAVPERVWFKNEPDGTQLIQVQPDRFAFNWRASAGRQYPSYAKVSSACLNEFDGFVRFCGETSLGNVVPNVCEVVYVNHLQPEPTETAMELFGKVFAGMRWQHSDAWLPSPAGAIHNRVYVIGENRGRLYAEAAVAPGAEGKPDFVVLTMTARVNHVAGNPGSVRDSLQLAHDWVVNGFVSLTEPDVQVARWGKRRELA